MCDGLDSHSFKFFKVKYCLFWTSVIHPSYFNKFSIIIYDCLLGGQTIHGALGLRYGDGQLEDTGSKKLAEMREKLSELKLIIIDEMSLISSDFFYRIDAQLRLIFNKRKKTPFGGIGIMLVGDLLQIPPPRGDYIFAKPLKEKWQVSYNLQNLWELFEPWILKNNHRQGDGCVWANSLNRFREGIVEEEDLKLLQSRETNDPHLDFDSMHLAYTNLETQDHNDKMMSKLKTPLVEFKAVKKYPKGRRAYIRPDGRIEDTNILDKLKVKVGARIALVWNIDTIDDLVNGSTGTIIAFEPDINNIECIIVRFDNNSWGRMQRERNPKYAKMYQKENGTPIFREPIDVMGKTKNGNFLGTGSAAKIIQFPIVPFYASTNHKIQVKHHKILIVFKTFQNCSEIPFLIETLSAVTLRKHKLFKFQYISYFCRDQQSQQTQKLLSTGAQHLKGRRMQEWLMWHLDEVKL